MALPHMGEWQQLVTAARLAVDSEPAQEVRHAPGALVNQFSRQGDSLNVGSSIWAISGVSILPPWWPIPGSHGDVCECTELRVGEMSTVCPPPAPAHAHPSTHLVPLPTSRHPQPHCHAFHGAEMLKSQPSLLTKASAG